MPQLLTVCWADGKPYQAIYGVQGEMEIFNPIEPRVYTVMEGLLQEVKDRFPSNYIHLGKYIRYSSRTPHLFIVLFKVWMKYMINVGKLMSSVDVTNRMSTTMNVYLRLSNPDIQQWMINNHVNSSVALHTFYADKILNISRKINVSPIVWQDVWDEKVQVR